MQSFFLFSGEEEGKERRRECFLEFSVGRRENIKGSLGLPHLSSHVRFRIQYVNMCMFCKSTKYKTLHTCLAYLINCPMINILFFGQFECAVLC